MMQRAVSLLHISYWAISSMNIMRSTSTINGWKQIELYMISMNYYDCKLNNIFSWLIKCAVLWLNATANMHGIFWEYEWIDREMDNNKTKIQFILWIYHSDHRLRPQQEYCYCYKHIFLKWRQRVKISHRNVPIATFKSFNFYFRCIDNNGFRQTKNRKLKKLQQTPNEETIEIRNTCVIL